MSTAAAAAEQADEHLEVVASGAALAQVSAWLGCDAASVLAQDTDPAIEAMFTKPHPSLLGLGAKYLSHKSMEASRLEVKLKHKLRKSAAAAAAGRDADDEAGNQQYQPAQLERHQHKRKRLGQLGGKGGPRHIQQKQWEGSDSDSDEGGGKLRRLQQQRLQGAAAPAGKQPAGKVLNRSQLLQVPVEQLSKWQRKRRNQKAKKQQQQQGQ